MPHGYKLLSSDKMGWDSLELWVKMFAVPARADDGARFV
jgi:hypothetical protein